MSIYQEIILEHYQRPRNYGQIKKPTGILTVNNPLCGDVITMTVIVKGEKVREIKFTGEGCAISKASASMLTEYAKGKSNEQLRKIDSTFIIKMLGVELGPNRLKCALLPLEALQKLIKI
jgi:nitrogen fixation protein NifU and related proteins